MNELSVIIPAYNEAAAIKGNVALVVQKLDALKISYEIILVNDGSTDDTLAVMRTLQNHNIHIITYPINQGKGHAVKSGMMSAKGKFHLFMDADLSTSLESIGIFMSHMRNNEYDLILGERVSSTKHRRLHQPFYRILLGKIFTGLSRLCVGRMINDFTCGFKILNSDASRLLFSQQRIKRWGFDTEIIYIAIRNRLRIGQIPVMWNHHPNSKVHALSAVFTSLGDLLYITYNGITGQYSRR